MQQSSDHGSNNNPRDLPRCDPARHSTTSRSNNNHPGGAQTDVAIEFVSRSWSALEYILFICSKSKNICQTDSRTHCVVHHSVLLCPSSPSCWSSHFNFWDATLRSLQISLCQSYTCFIWIMLAATCCFKLLQLGRSWGSSSTLWISCKLFGSSSRINS